VATFPLALLAAAGAFAVFWALRPALFPVRQATPTEDRFQYYGTDVAMTDDVTRLTFRERMIEPATERIREGITRLTPLDYMRRLDQRLDDAGRPSGLSAEGFLVLRAAAGIFAGGLGAALGVFLGKPLIGIAAAVLLAGAAWLGIRMLVSSLISGRRQQVEISLPNVIDFLVISVSAGLTLDRALTRVVSQYDNALTRGLAVALAEVQLGRPRLEALDAYGRSTGVPSVHAFMQALIGSERMGVPTVDVLRLQAESARWRRGDRAARLGASATIKMTIPMVLFIFPTIWLVLLGPAVFQVFKGGF
jgi:tight adherence protein C